MMSLPVWFALLSASLFGMGMVVNKLGLAHLPAIAGSTLSIPTTLVLLTLLAPLLLHGAAWNGPGMLIFAGVGLFFPAAVALLMFQGNHVLGPTVTSAVSSTTPLFAAAGAALLLGEGLTPPVAVGTLAVVLGIALMSRGSRHRRRTWPLAWLVLPLVAALLRGTAQAVTKVGLNLLPNPFLAAWVGYLSSSLVVLGVARLRYGQARPAVTRQGALWYGLTGVCNGGGLLASYYALRLGKVSLVAPIVSSYPLFTLAFTVILLRQEIPPLRTVLGVLLVVAGIAMLLA